ncbi:unnamed protein product [Oikopleura dioica]|uniref:Uncharacterized protein n=1 Tax=Oikopleura dioica TaxID=34765 RepID=E4WR13_OIKDI|nr:unnamed protein product [Oikopleura dioica]
MGKTSQKMFNILSAIEFLVLGASLGLSIYILTLAPTLDNVFSIVVVAFTGFGVLATLIGLLGACAQSRCLLKLNGMMGIICFILFAIIAVLSGLWYGGIDIVPEFDVGNKNFTELCANFNETEFEKTQNDILINEINKNLEDNEVADEPEDSEPISDAQVQESTTTMSTTTALSIEEKQLDVITTTSASTTFSNTISTTSLSAEDDNLPVDNRLLYYYCELEGFMLEIMFGRADANSDSDSAKIMLAILIISCCVSVFYLLSSCLAFYAAKNIDQYSGY